MSDLLSRVFHTLYPLTQDKLQSFVADVGPNTFYAVLFTIIFCETGLVVLPFLPGDSLLFAVGAVGASSNAPYSVTFAGALLVVAALLGDNCNYWLGRKLGPAVFSVEDPASQATGAGIDASNLASLATGRRSALVTKLFNRKHLVRTQAFYERYGTKMVILARFVPIVRTFAPFVAGVGKMNYARFLTFSVIGAILWVSICMAAGSFFGGFEFVKKHFEAVIMAVILISVLPMVVEYLLHRARAKKAAAQAEAV
jgi:membrane-associated protein